MLLQLACGGSCVASLPETTLLQPALRPAVLAGVVWPGSLRTVARVGLFGIRSRLVPGLDEGVSPCSFDCDFENLFCPGE